MGRQWAYMRRAVRAVRAVRAGSVVSPRNFAPKAFTPHPRLLRIGTAQGLGAADVLAQPAFRAGSARAVLQRSPVVPAQASPFSTAASGGKNGLADRVCDDVQRVQADIDKTEAAIQRCEADITRVETAVHAVQAKLDSFESDWASMSKLARARFKNDPAIYNASLESEKQDLVEEKQALRDEKNKLRDKEKDLRDHEKSLQGDAIISSVERPSVFTAKDGSPTRQARLDRLWAQYLRCDPETAEDEQAFLRAVMDAEVVSESVKEMDVETGNVNWTNTALGDHVGVERVVWDEDYLDEGISPGMGLVTLPVELPISIVDGEKGTSKLDTELDGKASNVLFVRNEDVGLMKAWMPVKKRALLLGNPGISKSRHLWKYLVMAANPRIWAALVEDDEPFPDDYDTIVFVSGVTTGVFNVDVYFLADKTVHAFQPQLGPAVLNVLGGLARVGTGVRMLYEPGSNDSEVPHNLSKQSKMACLAACSPNKARYKEYVKQGGARVFYMPCPTLAEILVMGSRLNHALDGGADGLAKHVAQIRKRVAEIGPFTRRVFAQEGLYAEDLIASQKAILNMPRSAIHINPTMDEAPSAVQLSETHRIMRYRLIRENSGDSPNFSKYEIVPAHGAVEQQLWEFASKASDEELRRIVLDHMNERPNVGSAMLSLEVLVANYAKAGLRWGCVLLDGKVELGQSTIGPFAAISRDNVDVADMKSTVLYYPRLYNFPFADLMWVEDDGGRGPRSEMYTVHTIQCTVSPSHPKTVGVVQKLRTILGLDDGARLKIVQHMATLPEHVQGYVNAGTARSRLWSSANFMAELEAVHTEVEIRVLVSHYGMLNMATVLPGAVSPPDTAESGS